MVVDKENIENKLKENLENQMSKEEEIGFHKGTLNTLVNERNEFVKMIQIIESIMQAHVKRLEELGVRLTKK
ncbi:MAG: hypothetical protein KKA64_00305 [Nanoarchaeota archaeon]|nr:hypothetical protein [Nanoarchaeota archaeon]